MFGYLEDLIKSPEGKMLLAGAAIAATGGAAAPAVLGAEVAAGGAGASGLLGGAATAEGAGLLGAEAGAMLGEGVASGVPAWDMAAGSGVDAMGKLKAFGSAAGEYAKPAMQGMQAASMAKNLMSGTPQMPAPAARPGAPLDLSSIFQNNQAGQQNDMQESQRRKQEFDLYARNMMGGR